MSKIELKPGMKVLIFGATKEDALEARSFGIQGKIVEVIEVFDHCVTYKADVPELGKYRDTSGSTPLRFVYIPMVQDE